MEPIIRHRVLAILAWSSVAAVMLVPLAIAAFSPYLAARNIPYLVGGFAGIVGLSLLFLQPILPAGYLAGSQGRAGRRWHRWLGIAIVAAVALHVGGLYLTSPPDMIDALLLVSPTPFSVYGVTAMWGVVATALLVLFRHRLGLGHSVWRLIHNGLAAVVVVASVIHALQIEGAMEPVTKWMLCMAVVAATGVVLLDLRVVRPSRAWGERSRKRSARTRAGGHSGAASSAFAGQSGRETEARPHADPSSRASARRTRGSVR